MREEFCVYQPATGIVYGVTPPTYIQAQHEAAKLGGNRGEYTVRTRTQAFLLRDAFAHGRKHGHRQAAEQATVDSRATRTRLLPGESCVPRETVIRLGASALEAMNYHIRTLNPNPKEPTTIASHQAPIRKRGFRIPSHWIEDQAAAHDCD